MSYFHLTFDSPLSLDFHYSLLSIIYIVLLLNIVALYIHLPSLLLYLLVLYMYMYLPVDNSLYYMFILLYPLHLAYYALHNYSISYLLLDLRFRLHLYRIGNMFMLLLHPFMLCSLLCLLLPYNHWLQEMLLFPNIPPLLILYLYMFMLVFAFRSSMYLLYSMFLFMLYHLSIELQMLLSIHLLNASS